MSRKSGSSNFLILILIVMVGVQFYYNSPWSSGGSSNRGIEKTIEEYIANNPDKVIQALNAGQAKQRAKQMEEAKKTIGEKRAALAGDSTDPFAGNPNGDVVVVEFFDYNCGYCKKVLPDIAKLIEDDKNVKVVFKELPILSPQSRLDAKAALAVYNIDKSKYFEFHSALLKFQGPKSEEVLMDQAKKIGISATRLKEEMNKPEIEDKLNKTRDLATSVGVNGTPGFVIGDELIPGAIDVNAMKAKVAEVRKKKG